ncbi:hypothetical protein ACC718_39350, partial [Rhizobium ruizarguesonis]
AWQAIRGEYFTTHLFSVQRRVVNVNAALGHNLFQITIKTNGWHEKVVIDKSGENLAGLQNITWLLLLLYGWFWLIEI